MINYKVKLKLKLTKHCVLITGGVDNTDANLIFTITDTKFYVPIVTSSAKNNQKLSKRLSKGFEKSVYCNDHKRKRKNLLHHFVRLYQLSSTNDYFLLRVVTFQFLHLVH